MTAVTAAMMIEITNVTRRNLVSLTILLMAAAAFYNFAGEITEASPPPVPLVAATSKPAGPICECIR